MSQKEMKNPINRRTTISFLIVFLIMFLMILYFSRGLDVSSIIEQVRNVDQKNLFSAIICLSLYFLLWPLSLTLLSSMNHLKVHFLETYLIGSSEHFFSNITPFSSGGQPVQIYLFHQKKVSPKESTSIILANFIALMLATNLFSITSLLFFDDFKVNFNNATIWLIACGFGLNILMLFFMLFIAPSHLMRKYLILLLRKIGKIKIFTKLVNRYCPIVDEFCGNVAEGMKNIFANKKMFFLAVLLKFSATLAYYSIPYFLLRALGVALTIKDLPYVILATSFALTGVVWIPTPGSAGGIEYAFTTIFTTFAGVSLTTSVAQTILWRGLTYYLLILVSLGCYFLFEVSVYRHRRVPIWNNQVYEISEEFDIEDQTNQEKKE